jgi:CRP/FNR family transcriptional regulator, anaerobic regulatory protein
MDQLSDVRAAFADASPELGGQPAAVSSDHDVVGSVPIRTLSTGETLFEQGDPKTHLHEITAGLLCIYRPQAGGADEVIEIAFPGDVLGLGYLDYQIHCARALVKTQVSCLPLGSLDDVIKYDIRARSRYAVALRREFAYRRDLLTSANRHSPVGRVAAFLVAVSQFNHDEGRDPNIVTDTLKCGVVARWLKLDLDALRRALVELEKRRLIEPCVQGLRLIDCGGLEALAGGDAR